MTDWRLPHLWSRPGPEELCRNKLLRNHLSPSLSSMSQGILLRAACTPARFPDSNTHKAQQTIFISHSRDEPAPQVVEPASSWRAHLIYGGGGHSSASKGTRWGAGLSMARPLGMPHARIENFDMDSSGCKCWQLIQLLKSAKQNISVSQSHSMGHKFAASGL